MPCAAFSTNIFAETLLRYSLNMQCAVRVCLARSFLLTVASAEAMQGKHSSTALASLQLAGVPQHSEQLNWGCP